MPIPEEIDEEKLAEVALAILCLSAFQDGPGVRAWKGIDWDVMNLTFERGWIHDPRSQAKSVVLTDEGFKRGEEFLRRHFASRAK